MTCMSLPPEVIGTAVQVWLAFMDGKVSSLKALAERTGIPRATLRRRLADMDIQPEALSSGECPDAITKLVSNLATELNRFATNPEPPHGVRETVRLVVTPEGTAFPTTSEISEKMMELCNLRIVSGFTTLTGGLSSPSRNRMPAVEQVQWFENPPPQERPKSLPDKKMSLLRDRARHNAMEAGRQSEGTQALTQDQEDAITRHYQNSERFHGMMANKKGGWK